jgi:hypothetical protein
LKGLSCADKPAVFGSRVDFLTLAISGQPNPHQRLRAERVKRGVNPVCAATQHPMDSTGQVPDRTGAFPRQHPRLSGEAIEQPAFRIDVKGRGLLGVERTEPLVLPPRLLQRDVARDELDQVETLADLIARIGRMAAGRRGRRTGQWVAASLCFFASATTRSAT